jgi:hypothetical protein
MDAWLEQQSMKEESVTGPDGKAYTALAPRLYLPQRQLGQWANVAGGVIRGQDVTGQLKLILLN